jgi:hypothetical protein
MVVGCHKQKDNNHNHFPFYRDAVLVPGTLQEALNILCLRKTTNLVAENLNNKEHIYIYIHDFASVKARRVRGVYEAFRDIPVRETVTAPLALLLVLHCS